MLRWLVIIIAIIAFLISTMGLLANERFFLLFVVDIGIVLIAYFLWNLLTNKKIREEAIAHGANDAINCVHIEGLGLAKNAPCQLWSFDDRIQINMKKPEMTFSIPLERIRAAVIKSEQELKEVDRSVVGRALIGTLLVPGLGTIVGGMSGLKTKKKNAHNSHFLIINYTDKNGELVGVTFQNNTNFIRLRSFSNHINNLTREVVGDVSIEL